MIKLQQLGISSTCLKWIALICMVFDHIAEFIPGMPIEFRWIGRIAAPIFVFCMVEGVKYTTNRKKYLLRLYIAYFNFMGNWYIHILKKQIDIIYMSKKR